MRRIVNPRPVPGAVKPTLAPPGAPGDDPRRMPSLRQILAAQAPLLVLDAASARIQAGLLAADGSGRWETSDDEAGIAVFRCLEALGADLEAVRAFAFCSGPGSILVIRTDAKALRAWEAARGYAPLRPINA